MDAIQHTCTIAAAGTNDLADYRKVAIQTFADAYQHKTDQENFEKYIAESFSEEKLTTDLSDVNAVILLLRNEAQQVIGYAKLRCDRSTPFVPSDDAMELERIYLLKEWWGGGLGARLLDYCEKYAAGKGFQWIWLCVWNENDAAIRFYQRQGWEPCGEKDFQFGDEIHKDPIFRKRIG